MSFSELIAEYDWNQGTRLALIISVMSILIGLLFTDINFLKVIGGSIAPLLLLLYPWFFSWFVLRRRTCEEAPREYVLVFGWVGVLFNLGYIILQV